MFKLEFSTDNFDVESANLDIADILHKVARKLEEVDPCLRYWVEPDGSDHMVGAGTLRDANGNTIGKWEVEI